MASLKKPKSCPCGSTEFVHLFKPERWMCESCDKILAERPQRIPGVCRKCGASEQDKKFKKGKNLCLDCNNNYMVEWRKKNPGWNSDPEFRKRRFEAVRRAKQKSPEAFIKSLFNALTRPSRKKGKRFNTLINPKRLAILNDIQIDLDHLLGLYEQQEGLCALSGLVMTHVFNDLCSISVDRVDSGLGYVDGNIQLVCKWVNLAKQKHSNGEFDELLNNLVMIRAELFGVRKPMVKRHGVPNGDFEVLCANLADSLMKKYPLIPVEIHLYDTTDRDNFMGENDDLVAGLMVTSDCDYIDYANPIVDVALRRFTAEVIIKFTDEDKEDEDFCSVDLSAPSSVDSIFHQFSLRCLQMFDNDESVAINSGNLVSAHAEAEVVV